MKVGEVWKENISDIKVKIDRILSGDIGKRLEDTIEDVLKTYDKMYDKHLKRGDIMIECHEIEEGSSYIYPREVFIRTYHKIN